jgi:hypothetical protein
MKVVQNFNLEVGEGKPNLKLMPQRLQHHNIGAFTFRRRSTDSLFLTWDDQPMIPGGISCGIISGSVRPIMKTLPPTLLHLPKSGVVLHRTLFSDEIPGNPQKSPNIL